MLSEQIEKFKQSGRQFSSQELIESYIEAKKRLMSQWESTPVEDKEVRESIYFKLKAMDDIMIQLIFDWSK